MQKFIPKNPNFEYVVRDSFSRQPFMDLIGGNLTVVKPGFCEAVLEYQQGLTQQHGFFHGGLVSSLADSTAGYAAYSLFPEDSTVLTVDLKVNFLNPSDGDRLIAQSEVIRAGKTLYHVNGSVFVERNGQRKQCLAGLFTMMCLLGKPDAESLGKVTRKAEKV